MHLGRLSLESFRLKKELGKLGQGRRERRKKRTNKEEVGGKKRYEETEEKAPFAPGSGRKEVASSTNFIILVTLLGNEMATVAGRGWMAVRVCDVATHPRWCRIAHPRPRRRSRRRRLLGNGLR